jgi:Na+(H+)/acetate symporter ActP
MFLTAVVFTLYNVMGGFVATAYTNLIHIAAIVMAYSLAACMLLSTPVRSDA